MNNKRQHLFRALLLSGAVALTAPGVAMAAGTPACTPINNTATVNYKVGTVDQPAKNSNTESFTVGNKIIVTVSNQDGSFVSAVPGDTNKLLNFRITNNGNSNQTYKLTMPAELSGVTVYATTDNFNATTPGINSTGTATVTTAIVAPDAFVDVTINADIANTRVDADAAAYALIAQAYKVDGLTAEAEGSGSVTSSYGTCTTEIVFADTTDGTDDGAGRNGKDSARGIYKVTSSQLSFGKVATTIWDPINGNNSPKAIPGALIQYVFTIQNAGTAGASALLTTVTDTLSGNLTIDPDLKVPAACATPPCTLASLANGGGGAGYGFKVASTGTSTRASATTPLYFTTTSSADGVDISGQAITATMTTVLPNTDATYSAGQLKAGENVVITFNATIN